MKVRRHPKATVLKAWLDGGASPGVDVHVATCERCALSLESLAQDESILDAGESEAVAGALATVLAPPPDLADRLEERVAARLGSGEMIGIIADVFGAGIEASKLLFTEDTQNDNG